MVIRVLVPGCFVVATQALVCVILPLFVDWVCMQLHLPDLLCGVAANQLCNNNQDFCNDCDSL